jgi:hypothetical protein
MAYDEMGNYTGGDEQSYAPVEPVAPEQSPNSYDPFGNPVYIESEEERRKREEEARQKAADEADSTVAQKHEVTTYANGSKTVKSTQEIPAGQVAGPVRPGQESAINRAPMDPNQAYTAQMESGNNPNIGLHQPGKGTAYGTYGITAPAYADIQKANPKFAGRAISDLTPAEQGEAFQTLQAVNQQQLSRQGVAPTPENARLAHFLGATGAANYLKTGQISPQAAAANGGLQKALQIAQQRLAGTSGPGYGERAMAAVGRGINAIMPSAQAGEVPQPQAGAGRGNYGMPQAQPGPGVQVATGYGVQGTPGPVNPEQAYPDDSVINDQAAQNEQRQQAQQAPSKYSLATGTGEPGLRGGTASTGATEEGGYTPTQQGVRAYQDAQDNPQALMKLGTSDDPTVPDFIKDRARNRAADLIQDQRETKKAQDALQTMGPTEMAKYLSSKKTDETSTRVRGMLYAVFGNKEMAQRELDKLPGNAKDTYTVGPDGKTPLLLQQNSRGEYVSGYNAETGAKLSDKELVAAGAGVAAQKGTQTHTGKMQDSTTGEVYYERTTPKGIELVDNNGKLYKGSSANLRPFGIGSDISTKNQIQINELQNKLAYAGPTASAAEREKVIAESEAKYGPLPDAYKQSVRGGQPAPSGVAGGSAIAGGAVPSGATPGFAPPGTNMPAQGGGAVQPVNPAAAAVSAPAVSAPVVPGGSAMTPAGREQATTLGTAAGKEQIEVSGQEQKKFLESKQTIGQVSSDSQAVGNARRQQLDLIKNNPSVLNIMNGDGTRFDQARNIITRIATGAYNDENKEALYSDIKATGLGQGEQAALREFANLNTGINAKTLKINSGAGSISNAEQQANKDANIGNIDRIPAYAALSGLHRSQFSSDLNNSKQVFLDKHPELTTDAKFNSAWQKEEATYMNAYRGIAKSRFDVIGKPPAADASKEALSAYKDRIFRAFEAYPAPEFDSTTGKWNYKTANAQRAAAMAILGR